MKKKITLLIILSLICIATKSQKNYIVSFEVKEYEYDNFIDSYDFILYLKNPFPLLSKKCKRHKSIYDFLKYLGEKKIALFVYSRYNTDLMFCCQNNKVSEAVTAFFASNDSIREAEMRYYDTLTSNFNVFLKKNMNSNFVDFNLRKKSELVKIRIYKWDLEYCKCVPSPFGRETLSSEIISIKRGLNAYSISENEINMFYSFFKKHLPKYKIEKNILKHVIRQ